MTAASPATRKATERARRAAAGLVRVEVWCRPEHADAIKALAARLQKRPAPKPPKEKK